MDPKSIGAGRDGRRHDRPGNGDVCSTGIPSGRSQLRYEASVRLVAVLMT